MTRQELLTELSDAFREYGEEGITGIGKYGVRVMQLHVALVGELAQERDGQGPQDGGVTIAIHGESDDLVEVEGPCWDCERMSDAGEYDAFGATNKQFLIVDAGLAILARVYVTYSAFGAWALALAGPGDEEHPLGDDVRGVTTACADCGHSTLLTVHAPAGAFLVTPDDRREIAAQRAIEGLEE